MRYGATIALSFFLLIGLSGLASAKDCIDRHWPTDGCSAPGGNHNAYNSKFNAACYHHDRCYATRGQNKGQCDNEFLGRMNQACGPVDVACQAAALAYYGAVSGHPEAQKAWDRAGRIRSKC